MSAFERKRLENMRQNEALLQDVSAAANFMPVRISTKPPTSSRKRTALSTTATSRPRREARPRVLAPISRPGTRQSSRLAGLVVDPDADVKMAAQLGIGLDDRPKKRMRVGGDLSLDDISVEGRKFVNGTDGLAGLQGLDLGIKLQPRGAQPGVRTFTDEDVKETGDHGLKDLRRRMGGLRLYEKWAVNGWSLFPPTCRTW